MLLRGVQGRTVEKKGSGMNSNTGMTYGQGLGELEETAG